MADMGKTTSSKLLGALVARMKADKRFELAVYAVLLLVGVAIFAISSCEGPVSRWATPEAGQAPVADELEARLADILSSIEGAGEVKVMIMRNEADEVTGAIVTAQGAADIGVREQLQNAVRTVLGIGLNQVDIFRMESNNTQNAEGE